MKPGGTTAISDRWMARKKEWNEWLTDVWNERLTHVRWGRHAMLIIIALALYCIGFYVSAVIGLFSGSTGTELNAPPGSITPYVVWFTFAFAALLGGTLQVAFPSLAVFIVFPAITGDGYGGEYENGFLLSVTLAALGGLVVNVLWRAAWRRVTSRRSSPPTVATTAEPNDLAASLARLRWYPWYRLDGPSK